MHPIAFVKDGLVVYRVYYAGAGVRRSMIDGNAYTDSELAPSLSVQRCVDVRRAFSIVTDLVPWRWYRECVAMSVFSVMCVCTQGMGINAYAGQAAFAVTEQADQIFGDTPSYPEALEQAIPLYRAAIARHPEYALPYRRLAWACLEFGTFVEDGRTEWYRCGQEAARRALELDEANAEAHFLFAATTGLLAEQRPFWRVSPKTPFELERHLLRALAIDPEHARALNMMGMLLNEVPGPLRVLLQGKKEEAEGYLLRAVDVDPASTRLRLLLAEYYYTSGNLRLAEEQAKLILGATTPKEPWLWRHKHKPEAQALLHKLESE